MKYSGSITVDSMEKSVEKIMLRGAALYAVFVALGFGRIRHSFDRLPVDPGYEFFEDSYQNGLSVLVKTEGGYLDIPRRMIAELVTIFPLRLTGNVGSMVWLIMASATAVFVAAMIKRVHPSKALAIACGACVVLAPSASESQIGNQSVVKWFLILIAIIVASLPEQNQLSDKPTAFLVLLSGVSNPMTILAAVPLFISLVQRKASLNSRRTRLLLAAFASSFLIQLISWRSTGVGIQKYDTRTYSLWPGAGVFWYYNLIIPPLTCAAFVVRSWFPEWSWCPKPSRFIVHLSSTGLVLFLVTYLMSGIGDRYFVVPQILAFVSIAMYASQNFEGMIFVLRASLAISAAIFLLAAVKWYDAGWFLADGPKWSEQVDIARESCAENPDQTIKLEQALGTTDLTCEAILSRS